MRSSIVPWVLVAGLLGCVLAVNAAATSTAATTNQAAPIGHRLFFDPRLSPQGVACATCHQPERGFTDGLAVAHTLASLHRNTMTVLNVGHWQWLTWDGARDSLWHQAVGPIESAAEMASSRLHVVRTVMQHYSLEFAALGPQPDGWDTLWPTLPPAGQPGEPAFDALTPVQRIDFLLSLSSDYTSEWTRLPVGAR